MRKMLLSQSEIQYEQNACLLRWQSWLQIPNGRRLPSELGNNMEEPEFYKWQVGGQKNPAVLSITYEKKAKSRHPPAVRHSPKVLPFRKGNYCLSSCSSCCSREAGQTSKTQCAVHSADARSAAQEPRHKLKEKGRPLPISPGYTGQAAGLPRSEQRNLTPRNQDI